MIDEMTKDEDCKICYGLGAYNYFDTSLCVLRTRQCECVLKKCEIPALVDSHTQPPPATNSLPNIHELVLADMESRAKFGFNKYGTYLQPHNGRDTLKDTYQELLDACQYIRQLIFERDGK